MSIQQIKHITKNYAAKDLVHFTILAGLIIWLMILSAISNSKFEEIQRKDAETTRLLNYVVCERIKFLETESEAFKKLNLPPVDCGDIPIIKK
jgi:hypothetical protein